MRLHTWHVCEAFVTVLRAVERAGFLRGACTLELVVDVSGDAGPARG